MSGTQIYARTALAGSLSDQSMYQPFVLDGNLVLRACRATVVFYNDPTYTGISCSLYADAPLTGLPGIKIADSTTSWSNAEVGITEDNGFYELYFEFDDVSLKADTRYHIVFKAASYTYSSGSHLAFKLAYPDYYYQTENGVDLAAGLVANRPFHLLLFGAAF